MKQDLKTMSPLLDLIDSEILIEYIMENFYDEVKEAVRVENDL